MDHQSYSGCHVPPLVATHLSSVYCKQTTSMRIFTIGYYSGEIVPVTTPYFNF